MEQLDHEACETLESSRYSDRRTDFNEDAFCGFNVDL